MDEGAKSALESFAHDLTAATENPHSDRGALIARDKGIHAEVMAFLEALAATASSITKVQWGFGFGTVGFDGAGSATSIMAFPSKQGVANTPFKIIFRKLEIAVEGPLNGERPRDGNEKWDLLSQVFRAVIAKAG